MRTAYKCVRCEEIFFDTEEQKIELRLSDEECYGWIGRWCPGCKERTN